MLKRRDFVRLSALGGAGLVLGAGCGGSAPSILPAPGPAWSGSILRGRRDEIDDELLEVVAGSVPADMLGHALVVGGVPYGDGTPLFTGDAMVARFSVEGGMVRVTTRLLRTDDFLVDEAAAGTSMEFRNSGMVRMSSALGARDFVNTALVPSPSGRLLATYDAGRPWELDPRTLEPVTPVGLHASYRSMLPALTPGLALFPVNMTTAHPVWDPDEDAVYLTNWAQAIEGLPTEAFTRVLRWDGRSEPVATTLLDASGAPAALEQSSHQIHTTRSYLVISDGAFQVEAEQMAGRDVTRAQRPSSVLWIVPKAELTGGTATATRVEIPVESAHFLVEREDASGRVTVVLMHQASADPSEWVRAGDTVFHSGAPVDPARVGMNVAAADLTTHGRYVIDVAGARVVESRMLEDERLHGITLWARDERDPDAALGESVWATMGFDPELLTTRITDAYRDHPHRRIPLAELPTTPLPGRFVRLDHAGMQVTDDLALPLGWTPMSPTFVPRRNGGPGEGYVVSIVLGPVDDEVWILDAGDLARGPLCRLRHPRLDVGFSLHTTWLGELSAPPSDGYRADKSADYGEAMDGLDPEARALVQRALGMG